jgi:UPF0148 protein
MEDKKISDIAKLLYKRAKMLSYHCPECKIPLFQESERIFCPSCGRDVIIEKTREAEKQEVVETEDIKTSLEEVILKLSNELREARSREEIREIVDMMEKVTHILERLEKFKR